MNAPSLSVLVPAFNDAAWLGTCLASLEAQSLRDWEAIVCDDASTDASVEVARSFEKRDPRFRLVANDVNFGMTRNWNRALSHARGRYVIKLDADDAFMPDTLQELFNAMQAADAPVAAYCRTRSCDAQLEPRGAYLGETALLRGGFDPARPHLRRGHEWLQLCFDDFQLWHSNSQIHRADHLRVLGGWDESWGCAADTDLILRVLEQDRPVAHVPYVGGLYRLRPDSTSARYRREAWLAWESALIHHESLQRLHAAGEAMPPKLRKAWWRYWSTWKGLHAAGEGALDSLREDVRSRLLARARRVQPPPWRVRAQGWLRQRAWDALHAAHGARQEGAGPA